MIRTREVRIRDGRWRFVVFRGVGVKIVSRRDLCK